MTYEPGNKKHNFCICVKQTRLSAALLFAGSFEFHFSVPCYFILSSIYVLNFKHLAVPAASLGGNIYTNPKSQRNSGLFCKFCTSRTYIHLNVSINIMPSYLSIASNISFNHQCLALEETTNFVEVGCLKKRIAW